MTKEAEYCKSEPMIASGDKCNPGGAFDLSDQVDKYLSLLGEESKRSDAKMADDLLF